MTKVARTIEYTTNLDGWGAAPTDDEQASFCAYVVHRLEQTYPGSDVTADVDAGALTSVVRSSDDSLDCDAIRSFVGNEIWSDWCGGARVPGETTDDVVRALADVADVHVDGDDRCHITGLAPAAEWSDDDVVITREAR